MRRSKEHARHINQETRHGHARLMVLWYSHTPPSWERDAANGETGDVHSYRQALTQGPRCKRERLLNDTAVAGACTAALVRCSSGQHSSIAGRARGGGWHSSVSSGGPDAKRKKNLRAHTGKKRFASHDVQHSNNGHERQQASNDDKIPVQQRSQPRKVCWASHACWCVSVSVE